MTLSSHILVYRLEGPSGFGPYSSLTPDDWQDSWEGHNDSNHPGPRQDEILRVQRDSWFVNCGYSPCEAYFGFTTMDELLEWFSLTELKKLKDLGFEVKVYKIEKPYYLVGSHQVMFIKEKATCQKVN